MSVRNVASPPLTVRIPSREADRPSWGRVGVIAAVGFIVGVAWPRLTGVRLGPSVPAPAVSIEAAPAAPSASQSLPSSSSPVAVAMPAVAPVVARAVARAVAPVVAPSVVRAAARETVPSSEEASPRPRAERADMTAEVAWTVALVRETPRTGKVVARLPRGTGIRIGSVRDGWYPVQYGDGFANSGWVFRGAIGK